MADSCSWPTMRWHHLEGTYPGPGLFRVFFYDDWTRPWRPRASLRESIVKDSAGKELATIPLQAGQMRHRTRWKRRIPNASLPLSASLRVRFKAGEPEKFFDFTFSDYSKEPGETTLRVHRTGAACASAVSRSCRRRCRSRIHRRRRPYRLRSRRLSPMNVIPVGTFQLEPIPANAREILAELNARSKELSEKIEAASANGRVLGSRASTKDLALALVNDHLNEIPSGRRAAAENAAGRLLRAAYAIDNFGDLGDFEKDPVRARRVCSGR